MIVYLQKKGGRMTFERLSSPLTVKEAHAKNACRLCGQPMTAHQKPNHILLNFGRDFSNMECVEALKSDREKKRQERTWRGWEGTLEQEIALLRSHFSDCRIKLLPEGASNEDDVKEIVVEDDSQTLSRGGISQNKALALIGQSVPHFHRRTTEVYHVVEGRLRVWCGDEYFDLEQDEYLIIPPNVVHHAESIGYTATVVVLSSPPWSAEDHIIARSQASAVTA